MHPNSSKKLLRKLRAYRLRRSFALVIGQRLIEAKARLPHGKFLPWIESEFRMSDWTAQNMMRVAKSFAGKSEMITDLAPSALYALAAPSTKVSDKRRMRAPTVEGPGMRDMELRGGRWRSPHF